MEKGFGRLHVQKGFSLPSMDGAWSWAAYSISLKACVRKIDTIMMRLLHSLVVQVSGAMMYSILTHSIKETCYGKDGSLGWICKLIEVTSNVDLICYKAI